MNGTGIMTLPNKPRSWKQVAEQVTEQVTGQVEAQVRQTSHQSVQPVSRRLESGPELIAELPSPGLPGSPLQESADTCPPKLGGRRGMSAHSKSRLDRFIRRIKIQSNNTRQASQRCPNRRVTLCTDWRMKPRSVSPPKEKEMISNSWSAVARHRFPSVRHVAQIQSADMSPHSKRDPRFFEKMAT